MQQWKNRMPRGGERRRGGLSGQRRHGRLVDTLDDEGAEERAAATGARGRGSGGTAEGTVPRLLFYTLTISDVRTALHTPPNPLTRSRKQVVSELLSEAQDFI
jgi:hypothetical protein